MPHNNEKLICTVCSVSQNFDHKDTYIDMTAGMGITAYNFIHLFIYLFFLGGVTAVKNYLKT